MSVDSTLEFEIAYPASGWQVHCVKILLTAGWRLGREEGALYLPAGDCGEFSWRKWSGCEDDLLLELDRIAGMSESIGLRMLWGDTGTGGPVIVRPDGWFMLSVSLTRARIANSRLSDASWYVERTVAVLESHGVEIVQWKWVDYF